MLARRGHTRTWTSSSRTSENARVWGGLHYRSTVEQTSKDFPRIARDVGKQYFLDGLEHDEVRLGD